MWPNHPKQSGISIDDLELIREELLRLQRELEKMENVTTTAASDKRKKT